MAPLVWGPQPAYLSSSCSPAKNCWCGMSTAGLKPSSTPSTALAQGRSSNGQQSEGLVAAAAARQGSGHIEGEDSRSGPPVAGGELSLRLDDMASGLNGDLRLLRGVLGATQVRDGMLAAILLEGSDPAADAAELAVKVGRVGVATMCAKGAVRGCVCGGGGAGSR